MKKIITGIALSITCFLNSQTATNFTANDCSGTSHDLFSELNSGKVVVICWVMPCATCISGALAAQSACNSFASSNPGQVVFYIADDYGTTSCSTISSWCNGQGISPTAKFSNSSIDMMDYGSVGMPKVVVIGDLNHTVYYNQNDNAINTSGIQTAIGNALNAVGVKEIKDNSLAEVQLFPNPAKEKSTVAITLKEESQVKVSVCDQLGQVVAEVFDGKMQKGENKLDVATEKLANGNYFIQISDNKSTRKLKLIVAH